AEAYNAFFFAPLKSKGFSFSSLFSTHPSLEKRLQQLAEISTQLGEVAPGEQRGPSGYDEVPGIGQPSTQVHDGSGYPGVPGEGRQSEPGGGYAPPGVR
ncbi:MAG: hypothetical protein ACRDQA_08850, partial [Nocardioidaceae bacterium]